MTCSSIFETPDIVVITFRLVHHSAIEDDPPVKHSHLIDKRLGQYISPRSILFDKTFENSEELVVFFLKTIWVVCWIWSLSKNLVRECAQITCAYVKDSVEKLVCQHLETPRIVFMFSKRQSYSFCWNVWLVCTWFLVKNQELLYLEDILYCIIPCYVFTSRQIRSECVPSQRKMSRQSLQQYDIKRFKCGLYWPISAQIPNKCSISFLDGLCYAHCTLEYAKTVVRNMPKLWCAIVCGTTQLIMAEVRSN